jgi:hypothetical protein
MPYNLLEPEDSATAPTLTDGGLPVPRVSGTKAPTPADVPPVATQSAASGQDTALSPVVPLTSTLVPTVKAPPLIARGTTRPGPVLALLPTATQVPVVGQATP